MAPKDDANRGSSQAPPVSPLASPTVATTAASVAAAAPAASSSISTGAGDAGGHTTATTSTGTAAAAAAAAASAAESSRTRRGLDRLSGGLRELGFEVLSRKQRHEREKSSSSNKSLQPLSGPVSGFYRRWQGGLWMHMHGPRLPRLAWPGLKDGLFRRRADADLNLQSCVCACVLVDFLHSRRDRPT